MKKLVALLLSVVMLCSAAATSFAATLDLSHILENEKIFTLDINDDANVAFIESTLDTETRSFVHKYESSYRYSSTQFDILVLDYQQASTYPVLRMWLTYNCEIDYLNIQSVSFILGNQKYTFSNITDSEWFEQDEKGYREQVLIKFGTETLPFLTALFGMMPEDSADLANMTIPMIMHGDEDIQVELGSGFLMDFFVIMSGMIEINGLDYLDECISSTMTVTTVN